jgi:nucleotide-binding universal stress UspA family protein
MRLLVTFISPKRSARTLEVAAEHARTLGAEIIVLKVVPDAHKVGVVAELIASDRPTQKATEQVAQAAQQLDRQGIAARGLVRVDEVTEGIIRAAIEWHVDAVYVGTFQHPGTMRLQNDPIARYLVEHCPANVVLVRQPDPGDDQSTHNPLVVPHATIPGAGGVKLKRSALLILIIGLLTLFALKFGNVGGGETSEQVLTANTSIALMDWHISGLWVINCPVAWVRVTNYNSVPIKNINFEYRSYTADGKPLDTGTFEIDGTVPPHTAKNFIELYLGLVALETERLSVKLLSVKRAS